MNSKRSIALKMGLGREHQHGGDFGLLFGLVHIDEGCLKTVSLPATLHNPRHSCWLWVDPALVVSKASTEDKIPLGFFQRALVGSRVAQQEHRGAWDLKQVITLDFVSSNNIYFLPYVLPWCAG